MITNETIEKARHLPHPSMRSENFAEFANRVPTAHLRKESKIDGLDTMIHRSNHDCNEQVIPTGMRVLWRGVLYLLGADSRYGVTA